MPNQELTAPSPVDACPVCRTRNGDSVSLYTPNGAVIKPDNARPEAPTVPLPAPDRAPEPGSPEPPTQSIQFWQGLAAGLAAAIFTLFLIAVLLAG